MQNTINYYNENAKAFIEGTVSVEFTRVQDAFLQLLPSKGKILDFGCGSGRDTKYFLEHGYKVDATDGSIELCKLASKYTGINVKHMLFQELAEVEKYDGIWACASILHVKRTELPEILQKMYTATKKNGVSSAVMFFFFILSDFSIN